MLKKIDLGIILVSYNTKELTLNAIDSIYKSKPHLVFDIWLIDNNSTDGTAGAISRHYPKVHIIKNSRNIGFAAGNNVAIRKIYERTKYVLLLNTDTIITRGDLTTLLKVANEHNWDILSCYLKNPNDTFQPNAGDLPTPVPLLNWLSGLDDIVNKIFPFGSFHQNSLSYYKNNISVGWVGGTAMLIRASVFEKIGFLDERIFMYGEDVEFCWRARKNGLRIGWTNDLKITHIGGASSKEPKFAQWGGELKGLLYLYSKFYGKLGYVFLKFFIYLFLVLRVFAYSMLAKFDYAKTYARIATTL